MLFNADATVIIANLNTTIIQTIDVTATWTTADVGNILYIETFSINLQ